MNGNTDNRGIVLIMAVIIGAGMTIIGIEVALFVVSAFQQSRTTDSGLLSRYAAESGIESALYQLKNDIVYEPTDLKRLTSPLPSSSVTFAQSDNASAVDEAKFDNEIPEFIKNTLPEHRSVIFDLYKVVGGNTAPVGFKTMKIEWNTSKCDLGLKVQLELSAVDWSVDAGAINWDDATVKTASWGQQVDEKIANINFSQFGFPMHDFTNKPLVVQIKPTQCSLTGLRVTLLDAQNARVSIPNYFLIKPSGSSGSVSKNDLQAIVPGRDTHSGLFDFTVFSEEEVCKDC